MAKILIVEDAPDVLKSVAMVLKVAGHQVVGVEAGQPALDLLDREAFDVLITDIRMSPVDGLQVLKAARERFPDLPLIVISAVGAETTIADAQRLGCDIYIRKPFTMQEVQEAVERVLRDRKPRP